MKWPTVCAVLRRVRKATRFEESRGGVTMLLKECVGMLAESQRSRATCLTEARHDGAPTLEEVGGDPARMCRKKRGH